MKKNHTTKSPSSYDFLIFGKSLFIVSETESIFKKKIRNKNMIMITKMVMIMIIKIAIIIIIMMRKRAIMIWYVIKMSISDEPIRCRKATQQKQKYKTKQNKTI